jgi:hypothetical protein
MVKAIQKDAKGKAKEAKKSGGDLAKIESEMEARLTKATGERDEALARIDSTRQAAHAEARQTSNTRVQGIVDEARARRLGG